MQGYKIVLGGREGGRRREGKETELLECDGNPNTWMADCIQHSQSSTNGDKLIGIVRLQKGLSIRCRLPEWRNRALPMVS